MTLALSALIKRLDGRRGWASSERNEYSSIESLAIPFPSIDSRKRRMEALVRTRRSSLAGVNLDLRPVITPPRIPTHHHVDEGDYRVAGREGKGSSFKRKGFTRGG